jgi:hypothetical protein
MAQLLLTLGARQQELALPWSRVSPELVFRWVNWFLLGLVVSVSFTMHALLVADNSFGRTSRR